MSVFHLEPSLGGLSPPALHARQLVPALAVVTLVDESARDGARPCIQVPARGGGGGGGGGWVVFYVRGGFGGGVYLRACVCLCV